MAEEYQRSGATPRPRSSRSGTGRTNSASGSQSGAQRQNSRAPAPRRRRSRAARVSGALLYVLFVIGISAILATVAWIWANDVLALNKEPLTAVVTLDDAAFTTEEVEVQTENEDGTVTVSTETVKVADLDYVADVLKENGLIEYKTLFKLFATFTHSVDGISPGTYELDTDMDYRALLTNLGRNSATRQVVEVTIPEGYTIDQTFALLEENGVSTVEELQDTAANYDYKFIWLQNVIPLGDYHRLEGYLFPDTYEFYAGEDPVYAINKMLANFERRMEDYFQQIADQGQTLREIVNVAAMIERETDGQDQTTIASVIYNRLNNNDGGTYGYLQIDATIQYALPEHKETLTDEDKAIDSPYNTYLYPGLPAGPICNPGMASLYAAMNPESTSYYYYALGDDGVHHFFRTYSEQQNFIASQERYQ